MNNIKVLKTSSSTILLLLSCIGCTENVPKITLEANDITGNQALEMLREECGSSVGELVLLNGDEEIYMNFNDIDCKSAVELLRDVDRELPNRAREDDS